MQQTNKQNEIKVWTSWNLSKPCDAFIDHVTQTRNYIPHNYSQSCFKNIEILCSDIILMTIYVMKKNY